MSLSQVTTETIISPKGVDRIRAGHLWVFRSDVLQAPHVADSGAITRVVDAVPLPCGARSSEIRVPVCAL